MNRNIPVVSVIRKLLAMLILLTASTLGFSAAGWAASYTPKNAFNILMNYELGMHCTGFEFSYCCVLPPYNSILAQVVKTQQVDPQNCQDGNSQGGNNQDGNSQGGNNQDGNSQGGSCTVIKGETTAHLCKNGSCTGSSSDMKTVIDQILEKR